MTKSISEKSMTEISEGIAVFESGKYGQKNEDGVNSYRIPALLCTEKGTIIAGADQRHDHHHDWGNIDMVIRRSGDNGETWGPIIKVVDLQENPNTANPDYGAAYNIDMSLFQDPETGRIFALYDMFGEERGVFGLMERPNEEKQYSFINGKHYLNVYKEKETEPYTVREKGWIYDPDGNKTEYRAVVHSEKPPYHDLGDLYKNDERVGNIYFMTNSDCPFRITNNVYLWLSYSDDDGLNWSCPRDITFQVKKPWMNFYGIGPGTGIVLHSGPHKNRFVVPVYSTNHSTKLDGSQSARIIYSDDHGQSWQSGEAVNDGRIIEDGRVIHSSTMDHSIYQNTESTVVQLRSGALKMFMRNLSGKLQMATSYDGGKTWEKTVAVFDEVNDVYVQLSSIRYVHKNQEYIILTNANGPGRTNGYAHLARVEEDDSLTWLNHKLIQEGNFAYNALQQIAEEEFGVLFEHSAEPYNDYCLVFKKFSWNFFKE